MNDPQQPQPQPGQPYAQPGQPYPPQGQPYPPQGQLYPPQGQPYPPQGQPYAGTVPGRPSPPRSGGLGSVALLIAALSVAVGLVFQLVTPWLYASGGYAAVDSLSLVINLLVFAGAVTGLVLGLVALRRPAPHLLAAIAVGFAGASALGRLVAWASSLFYAFGF